MNIGLTFNFVKYTLFKTYDDIVCLQEDSSYCTKIGGYQK